MTQYQLMLEQRRIKKTWMLFDEALKKHWSELDNPEETALLMRAAFISLTGVEPEKAKLL